MAKKKKKKKKERKQKTRAAMPVHAAQDPAYRLELIAETKIEALLEEPGQARFEASGLQYQDGHFFIVLDNSPMLIRLRRGNDQTPPESQLISLQGEGEGYEGIAYQPEVGAWYCLIEAARDASGDLKPRVDAFDRSFAHTESFWLDFRLESDNKGFEGLSWLRYQGDDHLLGLCEGNDCKSGKAGRKPGKGRIQIFRRAPGSWPHVGTVKLPKSVRFEDYAGLDIRNRYVTVVSQASSAVWVGRVKAEVERYDDLWEDDGRVVYFPRDEDGRPLYCNLEGITWLDQRTLAVVSDKAKAGKQPKSCAARDQSIHLFRVVGPAA